jgi:hypothetical protein
MPSTHSMSVVFPALFGPSRPKIWPIGMVSDTPSTAVRSPYRFVSSVTTTAAWSVPAPPTVVNQSMAPVTVFWPSSPNNARASGSAAASALM